MVFDLSKTVSDAGLHQDNYLNEEEKPKIKAGDKVRIIHFVGEINCEPSAVKSHIWEVCSSYSAVGGKGCMFNLSDEYNRRVYGVPEDCVELIEPKEQTEEGKPDFGEISIPVKVDLDDTYWEAYTAELAKEVAVKIANKYSDVERVAEDAVKLAKSVVENLRKK